MFDNSLVKKNAVILFGVVLILLIANIVVKKINDKGEPPKNRKPLSGIEINNIFNAALKNYGLSSNWITKKKIKNVSDDSLYAAYSIRVPKNLPIHLLILELQNLFWDDAVQVSSQEIISGKNTLLKLSSERHLKLAAEFNYDEKAIREFGAVSFLVVDFPSDEDAKLNELFNTSELFYLVLSPSEHSKKIISALDKSGKRYAVLLDDNITELNYKLDGSYSEDRLKRSIREIVGTFSNAVFFIIDDRSDLYESQKYKFIESEFSKRKITIVRKSRLASINSNNVNVDNKFQDYMLTIQKKDEKILMVSADEYLTIVQLIPSYRKIGYKFIYPGDIIIKR